MNRIAMFFILFGLTLLGIVIDPVLGGIFALLAAYWYYKHYEEFDYQVRVPKE